MTGQDKKNEKVDWSQPNSCYKYNNSVISPRRTEKIFKLMIEGEIEKKRSKFINDILMRDLELQELRREMDFSPEKGQHSSAMEWRRLAGQPTHLKTGQTARRGSTSEEEVSWRRGRRLDDSMGEVNDEVWKHLRMTGWIHDLPESPELGPTNRIWRNSPENIELRANCNYEEIVRGLIELCNLTDTGPIREVQNSGLQRDMTVADGGNQINTQTDPSKTENSLNVDLYKTELCRSWSKFGACIYDDCCHFAHGIDELRARPIPHRNYKTEMCKKFLSGFCPYGVRCCFVHNPNEQYYAITGGSITNGQIVPNGLHGAMVNSKENRDMIRRWHR